MFKTKINQITAIFKSNLHHTRCITRVAGTISEAQRLGNAASKKHRGGGEAVGDSYCAPIATELTAGYIVIFF